MSKHTPGPWEIQEHGYIAGNKGRGNGRIIARTLKNQLDDHDEEANARLIAAAPELLAYCTMLIQVLENLEEEGAIYIPDRDARLLRKIHSTINKAEGIDE